MLPVMMSAPEQSTLRDFLRCAKTYLEFGCGGSTVLAARLVRDAVVSVESSAAWADRVEADVAALGQQAKVSLLRVDIGLTGEVGFPTDESRKDDWPRYHEAVWEQASGEAIDLFLVDGRFRLACLAQIVLRCRPDAVILIHDYLPRPHYHAATVLAAEICRTGALSAFVRRGDVGPEAARSFLDRYAWTPA